MCNSKYAQFSIQLTNFLKGCNKEIVIILTIILIHENFGRNSHSKFVHTEQNTVYPVLYTVRNFYKWDEFEYIYMYEPYLQKLISIPLSSCILY